MSRFPRRPAAFLLVLAVATGCGGPSTVDRAELEEQVQTRLSESVGTAAPEASCPEELQAEQDATTRCTMTFDEGKLGITVKVTSVDGDNAKFDIQADEALQQP